jgi:hypothetical protein
MPFMHMHDFRQPGGQHGRKKVDAAGFMGRAHPRKIVAIGPNQVLQIIDIRLGMSEPKRKRGPVEFPPPAPFGLLRGLPVPDPPVVAVSRALEHRNFRRRIEVLVKVFP